MQLRHHSDVHRSMVTVAGRRGDRRSATPGGVSSVAGRTDHGAAVCLPERSPAYSFAAADRRAIGGVPVGRSAPVRMTSVARFGTDDRSGGRGRARAFLTRLFAKWSSRRNQRWPLLSSRDATFIETGSQACVIRVSPRSRCVVSRPIADRRCCGGWRLDDRVRSRVLGTDIPSRRG
jgi:hypothetical protein